MTTTLPPLPEPDEISAPFWEACRRHELVVQTCSDCATPRFHPRPMCPVCNSLEHEWRPAAGSATLYSWVVAHKPLLPTFAEQAPFPVLLVELAEGVRMLGNLADPTDALLLDFGLALRVDWHDVTEDVTFPVWRPA